MNATLGRGPLVPQLERLLRDRIATGTWTAGQRLPREADLAAELGVGRSSLREAIRLLVHDGVLDVRHGVGTFVAEAAPTPDVETLLRRARLLEVFEVRRALEVEAARLAAARARPDALDPLREALRERHHRRGGDLAEFVAADLDFHAAVVALSGNPILVSLFASVRPQLHAALVELERHETELPDTSAAHDALLHAVEAGDSDAAIAATTANIDVVIAALRPEADR